VRILFPLTSTTCLKINNNGHEPNIFVARRTNPGVVDTFQTIVRVCSPRHPNTAFTQRTQIPYYPVYFANASYTLVMQLKYPVNDSASGQTAYVVNSAADSAAISIVPNNT
jgi:hypothetical protein